MNPRLNTVYPPASLIYSKGIGSEVIDLSTKKILKTVLVVLSVLATVTQAVDETDLLSDDDAKDHPREGFPGGRPSFFLFTAITN